MAKTRGLAMVGLLAVLPAPGGTQTATPSVNLYGSVGGIDMPGADHQPAGQITTTISGYSGSTRTTLNFQLTDRLSGAFRYATIDGYNTVGRDTRYDRSFDVRFRILDESRWRPAVTIGLQDFAGTGVFSGEYIVATKSLTPRFKVTAGLGWGRLGGDEFRARVRNIDIGQGGKPATGSWFRNGPKPFGGVEWQTPLDGLTLKAEYSSDTYVVETRQGVYEHNSPFNFGLEYARPGGAVKWGAYYLNGDRLALSVALTFNAGRSPAPSGLESAPAPVLTRPALKAGQSYDTAWAANPASNAALRPGLAQSLGTMDLGLEALQVTGSQATAYVQNRIYMAQAEAVGRAARAMSQSLPPSVGTFNIVLVEQGLPISRTTLLRSDLERLEYDAYGAEKLLARTQIGDAMRAPAGLEYANGSYPRFRWSITPAVRSSFFDPDAPIRVELGVRAKARYDLAPGLSVTGSVIKPVIGNLDDITRGGGANPNVPRVRSFAARYYREGDPALERLTADYLFKLHPSLYGRVTAGYLETMYGGVSGELLWKPANSRLAFGAELNYVRQRDFDQRFGFRDYDVVTGHVSAYYDMANGFQAQIDAGRYLAGDVGATFTLNRRFENGWRVGAFFTLTDMSAADFGEGSFDKGILLTIPLHWGLGTPSRNTIDTAIRPLTRDGGARVNVDNRLYEIVRGADGVAIEDTFGRVWR